MVTAGDIQLFTPEAAAARLQVSRAKVYRLLRDGMLRGIYVGGNHRITARDLAAFIEAAPTERSI